MKTIQEVEETPAGHAGSREKSREELEAEMTSLREQLRTAHGAVSRTHAQMEIQKTRTKQLVAAWKVRLEEGAEKARKQQEVVEAELRKVVCDLLHFEGALRREQKEIETRLAEQEAAISSQRRTIHALLAALSTLKRKHQARAAPDVTSGSSHVIQQEADALISQIFANSYKHYKHPAQDTTHNSWCTSTRPTQDTTHNSGCTSTRPTQDTTHNSWCTSTRPTQDTTHNSGCTSTRPTQDTTHNSWCTSTRPTQDTTHNSGCTSTRPTQDTTYDSEQSASTRPTQDTTNNSWCTSTRPTQDTTYDSEQSASTRPTQDTTNNSWCTSTRPTQDTTYDSEQSASTRPTQDTTNNSWCTSTRPTQDTTYDSEQSASTRPTQQDSEAGTTQTEISVTETKPNMETDDNYIPETKSNVETDDNYIPETKPNMETDDNYVPETKSNMETDDNYKPETKSKMDSYDNYIPETKSKMELDNNYVFFCLTESKDTNSTSLKLKTNSASYPLSPIIYNSQRDVLDADTTHHSDSRRGIDNSYSEAQPRENVEVDNGQKREDTTEVQNFDLSPSKSCPNLGLAAIAEEIHQGPAASESVECLLSDDSSLQNPPARTESLRSVSSEDNVGERWYSERPASEGSLADGGDAVSYAAEEEEDMWDGDSFSTSHNSLSSVFESSLSSSVGVPDDRTTHNPPAGFPLRRQMAFDEKSSVTSQEVEPPSGSSWRSSSLSLLRRIRRPRDLKKKQATRAKSDSGEMRNPPVSERQRKHTL